MHLIASLPLFAELQTRGWFPLWAAVPLGLLAMIGVGVLYVLEAGRLHVLPRVVMAVFRMGVVAAVAFLLLRPVWVREERGERRRPVAVLLDVSQSMKSADPRPNVPDRWRVAVAYDKVDPTRPIPESPTSAELPVEGGEKITRIDVVKAAFENKRLNLLAKMRAVGPVEPATFGARRAAKDANKLDWLTQLAATEPRTAIADSAFELLSRDENEQPAAIVLATDGRENASDRSLDDLARECVKRKIPLHVYGVGSSSFGQLQLRDAAVPDTLFVDDIVSVPVRYRLRGVKEGKVEIVLKLGDKEVARKTVDAKDGDDLKEVLGFVPSKQDAEAGKQELTVTVKVFGEGDPLTDEVTKAVKVVDRKMKVLVVDSLPRWDFKFLQRGLLRDRRVEASFFLTEGDKTAMKSGPPWLTAFPATRQELFAYDLLILGDVPVGSTTLNRDQQEWIRDFVAEGGGLVHIAGRNHAPAGFANTAVAEVMPVEFTVHKFPIDTGLRPTPFRPVLTPAGVRSPLLSLEDDPLDNVRTWRTLPEIYWHYPVTKLKPAAEAFLVHPKDLTEDRKPMPLLAGHYYGKGYVLFVGFDETWRWRFNEAETYFGRFWSQAVYAAGVPRTLGTKLTQLSLDTPDPVLGKTGQLYARLFTPDFKPLRTDKVEARLERLDAAPDDKDRSTPIELKALPGMDGEFVATLPFNRVGRFALKVDNASDPAQLDYRVNLPPDHELAPGGMAEAELRKLAADTNGQFYREEDLHKLPTDLKAQYAPYVRKNETLLWNRWAMFLLIGLLSVEWLVRKFNSLS